MQAWPETGSWWGVMVLIRACLVWTKVAALLIDRTWSLEANFLEASSPVCDSCIGATHSQKDDVQRHRDSLQNGAEMLVLFPCSVELILRSNVLRILILTRWISRRVCQRFGLLIKCVFVGGWQRCNLGEQPAQHLDGWRCIPSFSCIRNVQSTV